MGWLSASILIIYVKFRINVICVWLSPDIFHFILFELESKNICYYQNQEKFDFEKGIAKCKAYSGFTLEKEDLVDWKELFRIFS